MNLQLRIFVRTSKTLKELQLKPEVFKQALSNSNNLLVIKNAYKRQFNKAYRLLGNLYILIYDHYVMKLK